MISQIPSVGSRAIPNAFEEDVKQARENIISELRSGQDVVLFGHSYGSIYGCAALKGLKVLTEEEKFEGHVLRFVAYSAWLLPEGRSLLDEIGGDISPWLRVEVITCSGLAATTAEIRRRTKGSQTLAGWPNALLRR